MGRQALAKLEVASHEDDVTVPPVVRRLASAVRKARERKGWSQRTLAEVADLNHELVRRIELGSDPRWSVGVRLAKLLDIDLARVLHGR